MIPRNASIVTKSPTLNCVFGVIVTVFVEEI